MRNKVSLLVIVILALCLTVLSVFADDLADVKANGKLVFGTSTESIPFVFYDDTGYLTGLDVELVREIGRRMGVGVETIDMAFEGLFDSLTIGQVDMIGGALSHTDERAQAMDLSRAYYSGSAFLLSLTGKAPSGTFSTEVLRGKKLGVQRGTSFAQCAYQNLVATGILAQKNLYQYASEKDMMKALDAGMVDYAIMDQDIYEKSYQSSGNYQIVTDQFSKEYYVFAMRKNSTLTVEVNRLMNEMLKDGTAQTIADKFFAMDFTESRSISRSTGATATPLPTVVATQAASCTNAMQFIQDVTVSDGQAFNPGASFTKTWRIRNIGTCTWYEGYYMDFASGDRLSGGATRINRVVYPGEILDISVGMKAPYSAGTYRGYWQIKNASGVAFGNTMWCTIRVTTSANPTATAVPSSSPVKVDTFTPNRSSGGINDTVTFSWSAENATYANFYVDGVAVLRGNGSSGTFSYNRWSGYGYHEVMLQACNKSSEQWAIYNYEVVAAGSPTSTPSLVDVAPITITSFSPSATSGSVGSTLYITWSATAAMGADLYVNGEMVAYGNGGSGSFTYSGFTTPGTYTVSMHAWNNSDEQWTSFVYTVTGQVAPTAVPYAAPTAIPYVEPTAIPYVEPTAIPYVEPTAIPYVEPTAIPYVEPTAIPYVEPTAIPYVEPTAIPYVEPTAIPYVEPTAIPYVEPTATPYVEPEEEEDWEDWEEEWLEGIDIWGADEEYEEYYDDDWDSEY